MRRNVLPEAIRHAPLGDKLQRLAQLRPEKVRALDAFVTVLLEQAWREEFYAGPRGGLLLKAEAAQRTKDGV